MRASYWLYMWEHILDIKEKERQTERDKDIEQKDKKTEKQSDRKTNTLLDKTQRIYRHNDS